jgi:hypothetical protein
VVLRWRRAEVAGGPGWVANAKTARDVQQVGRTDTASKAHFQR